MIVIKFSGCLGSSRAKHLGPDVNGILYPVILIISIVKINRIKNNNNTDNNKNTKKNKDK